LFFKGISDSAQKDFANLAVSVRYAKKEIVLQSHEPCPAFILVEKGLIRVPRYSLLGKKLTYLPAGPGEPKSGGTFHRRSAGVYCRSYSGHINPFCQPKGFFGICLCQP
jgi:hypothetical protein